MLQNIVAKILQPYFEAIRVLSQRISEIAEKVEKLKAENATLRLRLEKVEELIYKDK